MARATAVGMVATRQNSILSVRTAIQQSKGLPARAGRYAIPNWIVHYGNSGCYIGNNPSAGFCCLVAGVGFDYLYLL